MTEIENIGLQLAENTGTGNKVLVSTLNSGENAVIFVLDIDTARRYARAILDMTVTYAQ